MRRNDVAVDVVVILEAPEILIAFAPRAANGNKLRLMRPPSRSRPLSRSVPSAAELRRNKEHERTHRR